MAQSAPCKAPNNGGKASSQARSKLFHLGVTAINSVFGQTHPRKSRVRAHISSLLPPTPTSSDLKCFPQFPPHVAEGECTDWCLLQGHEWLRDLLVTQMAVGPFSVQDMRDCPCWHHRVIPTSPKMFSHPIRECLLKQMCSVYLFNVLLNDLLESYSCHEALKWMGRQNSREHAPPNQDESFQ